MAVVLLKAKALVLSKEGADKKNAGQEAVVNKYHIK